MPSQLKRGSKRYDSYSKSSQRPISYMSVDTGEPMPSPYSNLDNNDTVKHVSKNSRVKREVYRTFIPELDDEQMNERLENHTYCPNGDSESGGAPIFTISITLFQIGYFIYMYKWQYEKPVTNWNGWDRQFNENIFIFTGAKTIENKEYWRFFTYCFVHCGWQHLFGNMTMQLLLGCSLEFVHGTIRVGLLYILGVITGSLTALVVTPNTMLVGASGGDFCLIAAVIANVVLNCDSMHIVGSVTRLLLMGGYIGYEIYATLQRFNDSSNSVSWAAHMGGAMTGLLCGVVLLRNKQKTTMEKCFSLIGFLAYLGYLATVITVWFIIVNPPVDPESEEMILEVNDKLIIGGAEIETYEYSTVSLQHVDHPNTTSQKYLARTDVGTIRSISTIFGR